MNVRKVLSLLAVLLVCGAPQLAQAFECRITDGAATTATMALQISSLTVPRDAPNGTYLYTQAFQNADAGIQRIGCTDAIESEGEGYGYVAGVLGSVSSSAVPAMAGKIYETGVPGIGVVWQVTSDTSLNVGKGTYFYLPIKCLPSNNLRAECYTGRSGSVRVPTTFRVALVKTGPVGIGLIQASALGRAILRIRFSYLSGSTSSNEVDVVTLGLTGSIRVVSKTCTTSDVSVPLGRSKIMPLKGAGMSLPAVNFEIRLTDCPGFPGSISSGGGGAVSSQNGGVFGPSRSPNTLKIRIDPMAAAIDASKGVLSLTAEKRAATGVGVQLLDESGQPWILSKEVGVPNLEANTVSLTVKLSARYLQTAAKVTPGLANAVATYTLNYQ